jgi:ABC-2 type transport system ATP-binding protein
VIVNRGQVIAEDTPAGLSQRLAGADRFTVVVRGPQEAVTTTLRAVAGVARVDVHDSPRASDDITTFDLDADPGAGTTLAESVAAVVVGRGWGLREMRRVNLSLEDVFLQLTTSEPEPSVVPDGIGSSNDVEENA